MPPSQDLLPQQRPEQSSGLSLQASTAPLVSESIGQDIAADSRVEGEERDPKTGKRRLFGLGKKKAGEEPTGDTSAMASTSSAPLMPQTQAAVQAMRPASPSRQPAGDLKPTDTQPIPISPSRHPYPSNIAAAASPSRLRSSSPRLHSPASSEIFERNVQEPVPISTLQNELTPAHIPNHVMTEDHIPAALEASVEAITSDTLNADDVEIVTSTAHQPAAVSVLEGSASYADLSSLNSPALQQNFSDGSEPASLTQASGFLPNPEEEGASNYGALDPNDVRRLSFISFADVVQSEHTHPAPASQLGDIGSRDSLHMASIPSMQERTASPLRSPRSPGSSYSQSVSGAGIVTPPLEYSNLAEQSPVRSGFASPPGQQSSAHNELTIQTMRQAVRKTASGDLSGVRSAGMSPVSGIAEDGSFREARSRTNT